MLTIEPNTPTRLLLESIEWLKAHYLEYTFYLERDIVWTMQNRLVQVIEEKTLPLRVFNDFKLKLSESDTALVDLVIRNEEGSAEVGVEFKFEPCHKRTDIPKSKFPVVFWDMEGVQKDVIRIQKLVSAGEVKSAFSVFVDEGGAFRHLPPHPGTEWIDWEVEVCAGSKVSVLLGRS